MARREARVAAAYVAVGVVSSYALVVFGDPYAGGPALVAFLLVGVVASVSVGCLIGRWWTTLLPFAVVVAAAPARDVLDQLPLWAWLLVCAPAAAASAGVGVAIAKLRGGARFHRASVAVGGACLGIVALFILVSSAFVPQTAESRSETTALGYGYPLAWAYSDVSFFSPPRYPQTYSFNPWEHPTSTDDARFVASFAIIYGLLALTAFVFVLRRERRRNSGRAL